MSFGDDKQMFDVDETCAKCNAHISQLPFQPSGDRKVYCADCNRAFWQAKRESGFQDRGPRRMFDVDVECSECKTHISQLPFQPTGDKPVLCSSCLRAKRDAA